MNPFGLLKRSLTKFWVEVLQISDLKTYWLLEITVFMRQDMAGFYFELQSSESQNYAS